MIWAAASFGLVLAGALAYQWHGAARDRRRLPPPGRLVAVDGLQIHVHAIGRGRPAVVFVSGIAASSLNWHRVHASVGEWATSCAYDRPGLGWSGSGRRGLTAAVHAAQLRAALAAAGIGPPFVLVAHSFGSYIVQLFVDAYEADVGGVVLVDPITWTDWIDPDAPARRRLRGGALFARIGAILAALGVVRIALSRFRRGSQGTGRAVLGSFGSQAVAAVTRVMGEVGKMPPETWDAIQAHWSRPRAFLAMARQFDALPASAGEVRAAEAARAAPWSIPVVVLTEEGAAPLKQERHRALAGRSAQGRAIVVAGAGHWIHLDRPDVVIDAIRACVPPVAAEGRVGSS